METGDRSQYSQPLHGCSTLQDGNSFLHPSGYVSRSVGHIPRPQGRILPDPSRSLSSQIPQIHGRQPTLPVSGSTIRSDDVPLCLHQSDEGSGFLCQDYGAQAVSLLRRLDSALRIVSGSSGMDGLAASSGQGTGSRGQYPQVRPDSFPDIPVHRDPIQPHHRFGSTVSYPDRQLPEVSSLLPVSSGSSSRHVATGPGPHDLSREVSPSRSPPHETSAVLPPGAVGPTSPVSRSSGYAVPGSSACPTVVDSPSPPRARHSSSVSSSGDPAVHGRLHGWLGRSHCSSSGERDVVSFTPVRTHQLPRAESCPPCPSTLQTAGEGSSRHRHVGQHDGRGSDQEPGGDPFQTAVHSHLRDIPLGRRQPGQAVRTSHPRSPECHSRQVIQSAPDSSGRMVSLPPRGPTDMEGLGTPSHRSLCHVGQRKTAYVRLASPRSSSMGDGRALVFVDADVGVRVPSSSSASPGPQETVSGALRDGPDCTGLAHSVVVPDTPRVVHRPPQRVTTPEASPEATREEPVPRQPPAPPPARMEVVQSSMVDQGFSQEVARRISHAHRTSTQAVYDSRWNVFCRWCKEKRGGLDPLSATIPVIADFLTFKFTEDEASVGTIRGYRSVITNTLKSLLGIDFSKDVFLKKLISNFGIERPRSSRSMPQWDLAIVMRRLTRAPFEPMRSAPMFAVSWKTAFLLALASAKRRSELRAFSYKVLHKEDWSALTLQPLDEFVAKTEIPGRPDTRLQPVSLPGLATFAGPDLDTDRTLCPVRATKIYLSRTKDFRLGRKELFVPYKPGAKQSIAPATISSWIQKMIKYAYSDLNPEEEALGQVRAHDLRAMASSWNLHHSIPVGDILRQAQWRCHNTFTSFYLRDMTMQEDDILRLGPICTGGQVVLSS